MSVDIRFGIAGDVLRSSVKGGDLALLIRGKHPALDAFQNAPMEFLEPHKRPRLLLEPFAGPLQFIGQCSG